MDITIPLVLLIFFVGSFFSGFIIYKSYHPTESEPYELEQERQG